MDSIVGFAKRIKAAHKEWYHRQTVTAVTKLLSKSDPPDTGRSESEFDALRQRYPRKAKYGYDLSSLFERAAFRASNIHRLANAGDRRLRVLELGAGDGMLCVLLAAAGHNVTLCDCEDWRIHAARNLRFVIADCSLGIPLDTAEFDIVCSFNSFEHFNDPQRAFDECIRVTKAGGLLHFDFGPLYCSPYGLHAWSLMVPYPQFLFSESFIDSKLKKYGIWDLGKSRTELQFVNRWKPAQYTNMWDRHDCKLISCHRFNNEEYLDLIYRYPDAFRGRGLTFEDVTCANLCMSIQRT